MNLLSLSINHLKFNFMEKQDYRLEDKQNLLADIGNVEEVMRMIEAGYPIYPSTQANLLIRNFSDSEWEKIILAMDKQNFMLTAGMLIKWINIEHEPIAPAKHKRLSGKKDQDVDDISPVVMFLMHYGKKHEDLRWPRSFVSAVVDNNLFTEICNYIFSIRYLFTPADLNRLARRSDIIKVFEQLKYKIELPNDAQAYLWDKSLNHILAYAKHAGSISFEVFKAKLADMKSDLDIIKVAPYCLQRITVSDVRPYVSKLLQLKNFETSRLLAEHNYQNCPWSLEEQRMLLETDKAKELLEAYLYSMGNLVAPELQTIAFKMLDPADRNYSSYIYRLMCGEISEQFAQLLAEMDEEKFKELPWDRKTIFHNEDLWLKLLDTPRSVLAMKCYYEARGLSSCSEYSEEVLCKIARMPNAPELFAIFDNGSYDFPPKVIKAIKASSSKTDILDTLSDYVLEQFK